jgi:hypothetical protein
MNLTRESATRLACSEEVASTIPALAPLFERCAEAKRNARKTATSSGGRCRVGCTGGSADLAAVGDGVLSYLSTAPDVVILAVKSRLGATVLRFRVDGALTER